jgi:hypothetical protein
MSKSCQNYWSDCEYSNSSGESFHIYKKLFLELFLSDYFFIFFLGRLVGLGWSWGVAARRIKPIFVTIFYFIFFDFFGGVGVWGSNLCEAGWVH